ncbi:MAG: DRTGG domain-containing protein [SAR202 cluster bacterium]|nr:DRTGG domain-containing protein [SAR202 cluster bacterium]
MTVLYVASDEPGAGKTAFATTLAYDLISHGNKVNVIKPIKDTHNDHEIYTKLLDQATPTKSVTAGQETLSSDLLSQVSDISQQVAENSDVVIVEGPGTISPKENGQIADALNATAVLVTRHTFGKDPKTVASYATEFNERLAGIIVNGRTEYQDIEVSCSFIPELSKTNIPTLGIIPEDRRLLSSTIEVIAQHLSARLLNADSNEEQYADRLVEDFMVGGLGLDWGVLYFGIRENKAVVVRGDRPDVQMSALDTPCAFMILTDGITPIEYVLHEATLNEVPLAVVETSTLETMDALNNLQDTASFDHIEKVSRFHDLLTVHADLTPILDRLGLPVAV